MAEGSLDSGILNQLNSRLLDDIDELRHFGVGRLVNLPQIIVVGDQSSGKSSVLEAISRVRFPIKAGVCTRFATELVLRKTEKVHVDVKVGPRSIREDEDFSIADLPELVAEAKGIMGIGGESKDFSEEILRIEISGPDRPSLTLVDLPGIYHSETENQTIGGTHTVSALLQRYMQQKNSIILAVISAQSAIANQQILAKAKEYDERRERTLGIVTKVDALKPDSAEEAEFVKIINNEESANRLHLGWHVLRNRDSKENDELNDGASRISDDERDEREKQLFDSGIWRSLPSEVKGVTTLRSRLNEVLTEHIRQSLPNVIHEMEEKLESRLKALDRLGPSRETPAECQNYLFSIVEQFRDLTRAAVRGTYDDPFFNSSSQESESAEFQSDPRKLRAVIRNLNRAFDSVITDKGISRNIKADDGESESEIASDDIPDALKNWAELYEVEDPDEVFVSDLVKELEIKAANNLGTQFPGSPDDKLALQLFRDQSARWRDIASQHIKWTTEAARHFVERALIHIIKDDTHTLDNIIRECIEPGFTSFSTALDTKMQELLRHYLTGEALCLENEFRQRLSSKTKNRLADQVSDALLSDPDLFSGKQKEKLKGDLIKQAVLNATDIVNSTFGLERVIDISTVYYEMSLRTFIDNVIILAVENCLMLELLSLLTVKMVQNMDHETLKRLAGERPRTHVMRNELKREIDSLEKGLRLFKTSQPRTLTSFPSVIISPERSQNARPSTIFTNQAKTDSSDPSRDNQPQTKSNPSILADAATSNVGQPISFNFGSAASTARSSSRSPVPAAQKRDHGHVETNFDFNEFMSRGKSPASSAFEFKQADPGTTYIDPPPSLFTSKLKPSQAAEASTSGKTPANRSNQGSENGK